MSLRMRLFVMMGSLVALLVFAQWWWIRGLTRDLSAEVGEVAVWVGNHVASALVEERRAPCAGFRLWRGHSHHPRDRAPR